MKLSGKEIQGCIVCFECIDIKDRRYAVKNDTPNECIERVVLRINQVVDTYEVLEKFLKTCGVKKRKNPD